MRHTAGFVLLMLAPSCAAHNPLPLPIQHFVASDGVERIVVPTAEDPTTSFESEALSAQIGGFGRRVRIGGRDIESSDWHCGQRSDASTSLLECNVLGESYLRISSDGEGVLVTHGVEYRIRRSADGHTTTFEANGQPAAAATHGRQASAVYVKRTAASRNRLVAAGVIVLRLSRPAPRADDDGSGS